MRVCEAHVINILDNINFILLSHSDVEFIAIFLFHPSTYYVNNAFLSAINSHRYPRFIYKETKKEKLKIMTMHKNRFLAIEQYLVSKFIYLQISLYIIIQRQRANGLFHKLFENIRSNKQYGVWTDYETKRLRIILLKVL